MQGAHVIYAKSWSSTSRYGDRPGDQALADAVRTVARQHHAMLLANHGPVVSAKALDAAVYSAEELEETAKLFLLLHGRPYRCLTAEQQAELAAAFPS